MILSWTYWTKFAVTDGAPVYNDTREISVKWSVNIVVFTVKGLNPGVISKVGSVWSFGLNVVLNRAVVVDSDRRFDNLCRSHLESQSEFYHVSWWYYTLVIDLICQLCVMLLVVCQLSRVFSCYLRYGKHPQQAANKNLLFWSLTK